MGKDLFGDSAGHEVPAIIEPSAMEALGRSAGNALVNGVEFVGTALAYCAAGLLAVIAAPFALLVPVVAVAGGLALVVGVHMLFLFIPVAIVVAVASSIGLLTVASFWTFVFQATLVTAILSSFSSSN